LPPRILIVDPNTAFATVLAGAIQDLGTYQAASASSLEEALVELEAAEYAMAIVDAIGIGMPLPLLADRLRAAQPELRLMVVPGEEDDVDSQGVEIQGLLPKPFFVGELPALLDQAMKQSRGHTYRPEPEVPREPREKESNLRTILVELCQETRALSTFVVADKEVLAQAGTMLPTALDPLSQAAVGVETSLQQVAQTISEERGFQQIILEGDGFRLSLFRVIPGTTLVVLTESATPLGALRYSARQTCKEIERILPGR